MKQAPIQRGPKEWLRLRDPPLVVRMTGLFVVAMKVFMAERKPESSSKMTSTSSNRMREVAVFLPCSSLFSLGVEAAGELSLPFGADLGAAADGGHRQVQVEVEANGNKEV